MIAWSNDDLDRFPNVVLVDSNLYEVKSMKLTSWKEYFEGRLDSSGIDSVEVSNEEECEMSKYAVEHEDEKCLVRGDEIASISLIVEWRKDGTLCLEKGCKVAKFFLGKK